jgi:hypothetical protein
MFPVFDEQEHQGESPQSPNSAAPFMVLRKSDFVNLIRVANSEERLWQKRAVGLLCIGAQYIR